MPQATQKNHPLLRNGSSRGFKALEIGSDLYINAHGKQSSAHIHLTTPNLFTYSPGFDAHNPEEGHHVNLASEAQSAARPTEPKLSGLQTLAQLLKRHDELAEEIENAKRSIALRS
jgi:hypothetical protein